MQLHDDDDDDDDDDDYDDDDDDLSLCYQGRSFDQRLRVR